MFKKLIEGFCWNDILWRDELSAPEKYRLITDWAARARGKNPAKASRLPPSSPPRLSHSA